MLLLRVFFMVPVGFHRYAIENFSGALDAMKEQEVEEFDPPSEVRKCMIIHWGSSYKIELSFEQESKLQVRALIEGQFLSMRAHAERFGMPSPPKRIIATGGASANHDILSSIASIFGCDVYTVQRPGKQNLAISAWDTINDDKVCLTHLHTCYPVTFDTSEFCLTPFVDSCNSIWRNNIFPFQTWSYCVLSVYYISVKQCSYSFSFF